MIVDYAKKEDLPRVVNLVMKGLEEMGVDPDLYYVTDAIEVNWHITPVFCLRCDDKIVGVVPLRLSGAFWTSKKHLTSLIHYILPEYRNFGNIKALTSKVREYATLQGLPFKDTFMSEDKFDVRSRLLKMNGFKQTGIAMEFDNE